MLLILEGGNEFVSVNSCIVAGLYAICTSYTASQFCCVCAKQKQVENKNVMSSMDFIKMAANENHWRSRDIRCYVSLAGQAKSREVLEHTQVAASRLGAY